MRFYHYLFMLLFAVDMAAAAKPKGSKKSRVRSKHGWTSVAGCGADNNDPTVTASTVSSSVRPFLDAAIAGHAKCSSFERIAVYSCIPEPPPIEGLWSQIKPVVGGLISAAGTFSEDPGTIALSFVASQIMEGISATSASPDFASLGKDFETLVNKEFENVYGCIKESGEQVHAEQELHEWNVFMGKIEKFGDSQSLQDSAKDVTNRFETFFTGSLFPSDPSEIGRQIEALTTLEAIIPIYLTVAADYLASLYGVCKTEQIEEFCLEFEKWQKLETDHVDVALEWLYKVKDNILKQYESWTPKECDKWTNEKHAHEGNVDNYGWKSNDLHYTSHRECGSFIADIKCQITYITYVHFTNKYCNLQQTNVITYGKLEVPTDDVVGVGSRTKDSLGSGTRFVMWFGDATYEKGPDDGGLSVVKQRVDDAIIRYEAELKSWSNDFDNKYISPLMKFREDINSIVFDKQSNGWKQICYPQNECPQGQMNKCDDGNCECISMPDECAQQRRAEWQKTCGGTASYNARCVFPFTYKGTEYNKCITHDHKDGRPWCSTTANYDKDGKWGNCDDCEPWELNTCGGTGQNAPCVFPFTYKGKKYDDCTTDDHKDEKLWCSTTADYDADKKWGHCNCTDEASQKAAMCYSKGVCSDGYMDQTNGNGLKWACGEDQNCPGHLVDKRCNCACVRRPDYCAASAMSNPFERIGDDFIGDGSDNMPVYGPSGGEYSPYLFYFVAFVPCLLCVFVNVFCAYKQCAKKEDSYDEVRSVEKEEDEDEELMNQDNKI